MGEKNAYATKNKALALLELFQDRLPPEFAQSFDPSKFTHFGPSAESKLELLKLIAATPEKEAQIVKLWTRIYTDSVDQLFAGEHKKKPPNSV